MTGPVQFVPPPGQDEWPPVAQWTDAEWSCWLEQSGWTADDIRQYLEYDRFRYGVGFLPKGELATAEHGRDPKAKWLYHPTPRGVSLHACQTPNLLWGGAVGGAKSYTSRWEAIRESLFCEDFRTLIVRRELMELLRSHIDKIEREIQQINAAAGKKLLTLAKQPHCVTCHSTGSKIYFGHCADPGSESKFLSEEYDLFIGDEASLLRKQQIVGIAGRLRNDPKLNRIPRMMLTTNPGGPAHDYLVTHFITHQVDPDENPLYRAEDYTFLRSALYDCPWLMAPKGDFLVYEKRLYAYDIDRRRQLLNGDWTAVVGQFFSEFNADRHVVEMAI